MKLFRSLQAFLLLSLPLISLAQNIAPGYVDGELFWRQKAGSHFLLPDSILQEYQIISIESPFSKLNPAKLEGDQYIDLLHQTQRIRFQSVSRSNEFASYLASLKSTALVEKVPQVQPFYTPNDPQFGSQYNLSVINAPNAWNISFGNPGVRVALVDDAVLTTHQDLAPSIWQNPAEIPGNGLDDDGNGYIDDVSGWDAADNDNNPNPPAGPTSNSVFTHGTHCAGIAAAATDNGTGISSIGFGIKLIPVKCNSDATPGPTLPASIDGVVYAITLQPEVMSLSWGGPGSAATIQTLFDLAYANDIVVVAAAGNSNVNTPMFPASYNHVISVAATDASDVKASFSNFGSTIDVSAPGVNILSTLAGSNSSYGQLSGTSMACPLVAGLCGLMRSYNPAKTVDEIETCLKTTADPIDLINPGFAGQLGTGRVNAENALICVSGLPVANFLLSTNQPCPGLSVQFTDQSYGSPTSWQWTFPGGVPASSVAQNPLVTYPTPGIYPCTLIVSNLAGVDTMIYNNVEVGLPTAVMSGGGTINPGSPAIIQVDFTGQAPYSFTYTDGSSNFPVTGVTANPYMFVVSPSVTTTYSLLSMSSAQCAGTVSGSALVNVSTGCSAPFDFQEILGGTSMENATAAIQTLDCGYAIAGQTFSYGTGLYDAYLGKFDQNGQLLWFKTYGDASDNSYVSDVIQVSNGFVLVGNRSVNNQSRMVIMKTDLNGVFQWHQTIQYVSGGGAIFSNATEVIEMSNGDLAVAGRGSHSNFNSDGNIVMRLSGITGAIIWQRNTQVNSFEYYSGITKTPSENLVMSGFTRSTGVTSGLHDMSLTEKDGNGNLIWSRNYGSLQNEYAYDHIQMPDGGYLMVGTTEGFSASVNDILIIRTNSTGTIIWARTFARAAADIAYRVVAGCNGKYFVAGSSRSPGNGNDILLFQIDGAGNVLWANTIGGALDDGSHVGLGRTGDCGCILTASTSSFGVGENEILVVKTDSLGTMSCHSNPTTLTVTTVSPSVFVANPISNGNIPSNPIYTTIEQLHVPQKPDSVCDACGVPIAEFDYVTNHLSIALIDGSINGQGWQWDFGDGSPIDTMQNAVHAYPGPGSYTITLIVTSPCGSDTISKTVNISGLNECLHVYQPGPSKGFDSFVFSRDDRRNANAGEHPYIYLLTWTWSGNLGTGREYMYFDLSKICNTANLLDARLSTYYNTTIGHLHQGTNNGIMQRCITPWDEYAVTWNNQPTVTPTNSIAVPIMTGSNNLLNLNVTPMFQDMIIGPNYGFQWRHVTESTYRSTIFLSSDWPISNERPKLELRFDPIFAFAEIQPSGGQDTIICPGDSIQLHAAGYLNNSTTSGPSQATSYLWIPSTGLSCNTCPDPMASPDSTITYKVVVYNCPSCADIDTVRVRVSQVWVEALDQILCIGDSVQMQALHPSPSGTHFTWTPSSTVFPPTAQNPLAFPTVPTWYEVVATDTVNGCITSDSALVLTGAPPTLPPMINDTLIDCNQGPILLPLNPDITPIGSDFYEWNLVGNISPDPNSPNSDANINTNIYPATYHFILSVTNSFGCVTKDSVDVTVDCIVFPGQMISLSGQNNGSMNLLAWTLDENANFSNMQMEHSLDGRQFENLGSLNLANGQFVHQGLEEGLHFYRILAKDPDGTETYSNVIELQVGGGLKWQMQPNPAHDIVNLLASKPIDQGQLTLFDLKGRRILSKELEAGNTFELRLDNLAKGAYILEIKANGESSRQRLMVQ